MASNSCYHVLARDGRNEVEESLKSWANRYLHSKRHLCCFVFFWHALPSSWWTEDSISSYSSLGKWTLRETIPKFALYHTVLAQHVTSRRQCTDPVRTFGGTASTLLCVHCVTVRYRADAFSFLLLQSCCSTLPRFIPSFVFPSCSCITHWLGS